VLPLYLKVQIWGHYIAEVTYYIPQVHVLCYIRNNKRLPGTLQERYGYILVYVTQLLE
jgi:hypothetical protein